MEHSYEEFNSILLLGEADFSFARAFARYLSSTNCTASNVIRADAGADAGTSISNSSSSSTTSNILPIPTNNRPIQITATEYGDAKDIAARYYNGDHDAFRESMHALHQMPSILEIMCGLNVRLLGLTSNPLHSHTHSNSQTSSTCCTCHRWIQASTQFEFETTPTSFWNSSSSYDLIIFNFPHSEQAGRATKLVKALFKQIRACVNDGRLPADVVLEMRLRILQTSADSHTGMHVCTGMKYLQQRKQIRSGYNHEESAEESDFELVGCWPSDLELWHELGYQHKWTKKNASCRDMIANCNVWRWRPKITRL
jgi:hypothetical protein